MFKTLQLFIQKHIFYLNSSELSQNVICKELQIPKIDCLKACGGNAVCLSSLVYFSESVTLCINTF